MGIGAGAVGFLDDTRYYPHTDIDGYISDPLYARKEDLTPEDMLTEMIFLGLRSRVGISASKLPESIIPRADILLHEGKLVKKEEKIYNPDFFLADEIALFLLGE
jgi:oxygen-independent coproporphyrinogen-3 oxidase